MSASPSLEHGEAEFLGRWFVPLTLIAAVFALGVALALSADVIGFMLVASIVALALVVRYTWHKRRNRFYSYYIGAFAALHVIAIAFFHSDFSRAAGSLYMLGAFLDALIMALIVNVLISDRTANR